MSAIAVSVKKFARLLGYAETVGLDVSAIAAAAGLSRERLRKLDAADALPAQQYSRLFRELVQQMQGLNQPIPWGAGVGTEAFELMCQCVISARTLGDALRLAERYERLLYPLVGYNIKLLDAPDDSQIKLSYRVKSAEIGSPLVPQHWDRAGYSDTVAHASGLLVWHAFCGWLTGKSVEATQMKVAAPPIGNDYHRSLTAVFRCPVVFDAHENTFSFSRDLMDRRVVQTAESLQEFLGNSVYHLMAMERVPASTSAAIRSLVSIDLHRGMPSFADMAETLHMSESSLRRRLKREETSYQALKDEVRCEVAIRKLLNEDARVVDLAEFLGFTEPSSFVRSFKGWTGQTPKGYRDRIVALRAE